MSAVITSENRDAWQQLANDCAAQYPSVGKRVRITESRKHAGSVGVVTWHGRDTYSSTRYNSEASLHLRDMMGRTGYRVRVQPDDGEAFFIGADKVEVLS